MIYSLYSPPDFQRLKYNQKLLYTYKHWPFEPDSRFLPSRLMTEKMKENDITGKKILDVRLFPHATYDRIFGLNNTYTDFTEGFFTNYPGSEQNPRNLLEFARQNNIDYVLVPYINSNSFMEWWYSCAFLSVEVGANPVFIPQIVQEQKEFKTVFFTENKNGRLYLLRPDYSLLNISMQSSSIN